MLKNDEKIKGFAHKHRGEWLFTQTKRFGDTHYAFLTDLEELHPCLHEKEKVHEKYGGRIQDNFFGYECECGVAVEPSGFMEVKKND